MVNGLPHDRHTLCLSLSFALAEFLGVLAIGSGFLGFSFGTVYLAQVKGSRRPKHDLLAAFFAF
jgi:hypothetical protein